MLAQQVFYPLTHLPSSNIYSNWSECIQLLAFWKVLAWQRCVGGSVGSVQSRSLCKSRALIISLPLSHHDPQKTVYYAKTYAVNQDLTA